MRHATNWLSVSIGGFRAVGPRQGQGSQGIKKSYCNIKHRIVMIAREARARQGNGLCKDVRTGGIGGACTRATGFKLRHGVGVKNIARPPMKGIDVRTPSTGGKRQDALFVGSLEKGLRVLYAFRQAGASLGLREIAEETGLHVSAAQRFTHTLHRLGYLAKDKRTKRYRLAPKLLDFSFTYLRADGLAECATPHMIELAEQCDETINLSQLEGTDTICISRMPRRGIRSPSGVVGARRPAFCTSSGRAMLASLPEHEAVRLIEESDRTALTPKTVTGRDEILDRLAHVRSTGFGIVEEEFVIGEISIAAPILDYSGRPAGAVNIPVPSARWSTEAVCERLAPLVIQTARAISRTKGAAKAFD